MLDYEIEYNNRQRVPEHVEITARWQTASAAYRASARGDLDQTYGPGERQRYDLFLAGKADAPLVVYIHGGYWQRNAKEFFACLAEGPMARGFDAALVGYTLAPEATLTEIVGEVRMAIRWLRANGSRYGVAGAKLIVSGWSAGGHLTAMALAEADAGLAISGIFDIEPCRLNYLNDALRMTMEEQLLLSPIRQLPSSSPPLVIAYGIAELPELQRQSRDYHDARRNAHLPSELLPLDKHDHFSILEEMANSNGKLTEALVRLAAG